MKPLLKVAIILALIFATTFLIARATDLLTIDEVKAWFHSASELSTITLFALVVILLFADLFIAIPTLTVTILAGYFIGFPVGFLASLTGMMAAGISGYLLSRKHGYRIVRKIVKKPEDVDEMKRIFSNRGFTFIIFSRAVLILPEVSACLAGMSQMKFKRFLVAWMISSLPYAAIASYAGSISALEAPKPALIAAICLPGSLSLGWCIFRKKILAKS